MFSGFARVSLKPSEIPAIVKPSDRPSQDTLQSSMHYLCIFPRRFYFLTRTPHIFLPEFIAHHIHLAGQEALKAAIATISDFIICRVRSNVLSGPTLP
jgi:hypothetical protein